MHGATGPTVVTEGGMMAKEFTFPVWLVGSPEEQAAETARQNLARASFTRARLTEAERLIGRGRLLEATARENLARANGNDELPKSQLADALAMQGRYVEAADLHPDEARKAHFENVVRALQMDDSEKCDCEDNKAEVKGVELSLTPRFEAARIFSPTHNAVVSLITCAKCGHANARKASSRLLSQQDALAQSEAVKKPVLNDTQLAVLHAAAK